MASLSGEFIDLEDLVIAYRKAKADAFYERTNCVAIAFARFENNLIENLRTLHRRLTETNPTWSTDPDLLKGHSYVPKDIELPKKDSQDGLFFLDSRESSRWPSAWTTSKASKLFQKPTEARFRVVGDLPVEFHVISALWILKVGHVYDAVIDGSAYGARLRRTGTGIGAGKFDANCIGSFRPYANDFKLWRGKAFSAIRKELDGGRRVVTMTLDFRAFYHRVAPSFLLSKKFLAISGIELSPDQRRFTRGLIEALRTWASHTEEHRDSPDVGLPIGLSCSKVIANAVLRSFDRAIRKQINPIYYGRYVDDILLIFPDRKRFHRPEDVWSYLEGELGGMVGKGSEGGRMIVRVLLPYAQESDLAFVGDKQRIFLLEGQAGRDLLRVIEDEVRQQASEWRLLPELPDDESEWFKDVIAPAEDASVAVDNLRKAEVISVRRQKFSVLLRNLESIQRQLKPSHWARQRKQFLSFVQTHVATPTALAEFSAFLPRIAALAFVSADHKAAVGLIGALRRTLDVLERNTVTRHNGVEYKSYRKYLARYLLQSLVQAVGPHGVRPGMAQVSKALKALRKGQINGPSSEQIAKAGARLFAADLAREPYRMSVVSPHKYKSSQIQPGKSLEVTSPAIHHRLRTKIIRKFLGDLEQRDPSAVLTEWPLLFPTRPFTFGEITKLLPERLQDYEAFRELSRALRGSAPRDLLDVELQPARRLWTVTVTSEKGSGNPTVAVPCLLTEESSWNRSLKGKPDESFNRLLRLNRLLNDILRGDDKPDYVVLPELSIPRSWVDAIAYILAKNGVNLIAGIEYEHWGKKKLSNQVQISLVIGDPGYHSQVLLTQEKQAPAHEEADLLLKKGGFVLESKEKPPRKYLVRNKDLHFGVLICSELTDIRSRLRYRGKVDALFVVEWNKDINSFASLVEASALDVHCYIVQANNRKYGDCRIRVPHRDDWARDQVRIKGGLLDYFSLGTINVHGLRSFQSASSPPEDGEFKPTPDGFRIAIERLMD